MMEEFIAFDTVIYKAEVPKATDEGIEYNFLKTLDKACDKYIKEYSLLVFRIYSFYNC